MFFKLKLNLKKIPADCKTLCRHAKISADPLESFVGRCNKSALCKTLFPIVSILVP